ncbi:MAG: apolipoprotein N-acyltransferase [Pseudomonadales bacterium]|nr:apolipoprotein N-acyltransferase [Pseudomonadales bacterium]MDP7595005.1 apolipoprotein N-acyltransferase [Pseudomonadales bacterium]
MSRLVGPGLQGDVLALLAGCSLPLSFAPFDFWPAGLLSVLLLLACVDRVDPREAALRGFLYAFGMYGIGVSWIYVSIHIYGAAPPPLAVVMVLLFVVFLSPVQVLQCYLYARFFRSGLLGPVLGFTSIWVLQEWVRSWLLTGFPWLYVGYGYLDTNVSNWAPLLGVFGVSYVVVLAAGVLYVGSKAYLNSTKVSRTGLVVPLLAAGLLWFSGMALARVDWVRPAGQSLTVSAVQGNVDQATKWLPEMRIPLIDLYRQLSQDRWSSDIIVWPEAAITLFREQAGIYLNSLDATAKETNTTVITGIMSRDPVSGSYFNSVLALGEGSGIYHKRKLVPFGEYVPLEDQLRGLIKFFDLPLSNTATGLQQQLGLTAGPYKISTSVCYEVVYPELVRTSVAGADLLLTLSNDTWFGESIGPLQHMQIARMRALENGRYLIRATNNGVTAIVDHRGKISGTIPQFSRDVLTDTVQIMTGETPFSRWGSWPILIVCLMGLVWQRLGGWVRGRIFESAGMDRQEE